MLTFALILAVLAAVPMWLLAATGKATRGEYLVGVHLVTAPVAGVLTLALALGTAATSPTSPPAWLLYASLPGWFVVAFVLQFGCFQRWALRPRLSVVLAPVAVVLAIAGPWFGALPAAVGGWAVVAAAGSATAKIVWRWLGPRCRRCWWRLTGRRAEPGQFELGQAERQRQQWAQVPPDAGVHTLLAFVRSHAPEVAAASRERLQALPGWLDAVISALAGDDDAAALHVLKRIAVTEPVALAPQLATRLRHTRERFAIAADDAQPMDAARPALMLLEVALDCWFAGGDVGSELKAWQRELQSFPALQQHGRRLGRLRRQRWWRRWWVRRAG